MCDTRCSFTQKPLFFEEYWKKSSDILWSLLKHDNASLYDLVMFPKRGSQICLKKYGAPLTFVTPVIQNLQQSSWLGPMVWISPLCKEKGVYFVHDEILKLVNIFLRKIFHSCWPISASSKCWAAWYAMPAILIRRMNLIKAVWGWAWWWLLLLLLLLLWWWWFLVLKQIRRTNTPTTWSSIELEPIAKPAIAMFSVLSPSSLSVKVDLHKILLLLSWWWAQLLYTAHFWRVLSSCISIWHKNEKWEGLVEKNYVVLMLNGYLLGHVLEFW